MIGQDKDFYHILGVSEDASPAEIKRAYRRLAKELHPDKTRGDSAKEARFKAISEAYETLSDSRKRARYDEIRRMGGRFGGFENLFGQSAGGAGGFSGMEDFADLLGSMFGGGGFGAGGQRRARGPTRGTDARYSLTVPFELSLKGGKSRISVTRDLQCLDCKGSGAAPGSSPRTCTDCGGSGSVTLNQGMFATRRPCPRCMGEGQVLDKPCPKCRGRGAQRTTSRIDVGIPQGIADGQTIRLAGQGNAGERGGPPGDLLIEIRVPQPTGFTRRGLNIHSTVSIPVETAMLGGRIEAPTVDGAAEVKIPAGTQPGTVLRLKGRGMARGGSQGDHLLTVQVSIPRSLSAEERALLEKFAARRNGSTKKT